jgi:hypothetical protein
MKTRRKTPLPPLCPVHGVQMLVRHAGRTLQYRYCPFPGCTKSVRVERVQRLKNSMSLWLLGEIDEAGKLFLYPVFCR